MMGRWFLPETPPGVARNLARRLNMNIKLINKTGISNNRDLVETLRNLITESQYQDNIIKNYYKTEYNYNYTNNGNTWQRTIVEFRRTKKCWIAE